MMSADKLLCDYEVVREVEVTIKKPWAPIGLPLECVSISVSRKWHRVYLSLGSNMGDRKKNIEDGIKYIKKNAPLRVLSVSKLIETKPYGKTDQDDFINGAASVETILGPYELLDVLVNMEFMARGSILLVTVTGIINDGYDTPYTYHNKIRVW